MNNKKWTKEEENLLIELSDKLYVKEIAKTLNRSRGSVIKKMQRMNLDYITFKREYTDSELEYIKKNWGIISASDIARNLKISRTMLNNQAKIMNLPLLGNNPYRKWTDEKIENLKNLAKTKTRKEIAEYYNTTETAITTIAYEQKIPLMDSKIHWSDEDNEMLRNLAKSMDLEEISKTINRNTSAIRLQAKRLNIEIIPNKKHSESVWTDENTIQLKKLADEGKTLIEVSLIMNKKDHTISKKCKEFNIKLKKDEKKPWTDEEIKKLKELAKTKTINELVKEFKRSTSSIKFAANREKIEIKSDRKSWTEEDYKLLEKYVMIDKKTPKEIANLMGRTEDSIIIKISRRGLKIQTNDKKFWSKEEEDKLADLWGTLPIEELALKLNRTVASIRNKAFALNLGSYMENNYEGLTIGEISKLLNVSFYKININWISLGLKVKTRTISKSKQLSYVELNDLYDFLEANQNIWDSRNLEENILGNEPLWLKEKRKRDNEESIREEKIRLTKQQLILAKKYLVEMDEQDNLDLEDQNLNNQENPKQYINLPKNNN